MIIDRWQSWTVVAGLAAAIAAGLAAPASAQDELSAEEQQRVDRLNPLAASLQGVKVDRDRSTGSGSAGAERRRREHSELHLRFLVCAASLGHDNQDGLVVFPLQASGLTYVVDSADAAADRRETGADLQRVTITLAGIRKPAPKATIDIPALRHGSTFDAVQLARDEIIDRIRRYFPDAQIEGRQKLYVKRLAIKNESGEPLRAWLHYRTLDRTAAGANWTWRPAAPREGQPLEVAIPAGGAVNVVDPARGIPIEASSVVVWAESESGERWLEHQDDLLRLVPTNAELDGERAYYGERPSVYTHVIKARPGPRPFAERVVEFHNDSGESLALRLRYRTLRDGQLRWGAATFDLRPGEKLAPRDEQGLRIRASRLQIAAETANRKYNRHAEDPLWLVDEADGRRVYGAEKIGRFIYVFAPAGEGAGASVARISAASAPVMDGSRRLTVARKGESLEVVETRGDWLAVRVVVDGEPEIGWIRRRDAEVTSTGPAEDPGDLVQRMLTVTAASAAVKVGGATIASLPRGTRTALLEENEGWYRVEVEVEGAPRHGWVQGSQVQIK